MKSRLALPTIGGRAVHPLAAGNADVTWWRKSSMARYMSSEGASWESTFTATRYEVPCSSTTWIW
jgi:hypothetical protein